MTIEEMDSQRFVAGMKVIYDEEEREVVGVHFVEKLIALENPLSVDDCECPEWVRFENCEIIESEESKK